MNGGVQLTIQTLQTRGKKKSSVTTDAQHNISFRKLILGVVEEAADSQRPALPLTSSQSVAAAPPPPVTGWGSVCHASLADEKTFSVSIVALAGKVWRHEAVWEWRSRGTRLWLLPAKPQLEHFNQPLGRVRAWGGAKSVPGTRLWRGERLTRNQAAETTRENVNKTISM